MKMQMAGGQPRNYVSSGHAERHVLQGAGGVLALNARVAEGRGVVAQCGLRQLGVWV